MRHLRLVTLEDAIDTNVEGWLKQAVEAGVAIPKRLQREFYTEISSEDAEYRRNLNRAINQYGMRWV